MCFESNHHVKGGPHLIFKVLKGGTRFYVRYAAGDQVFLSCLQMKTSVLPGVNYGRSLNERLYTWLLLHTYLHFTCILNVIPIISWLYPGFREIQRNGISTPTQTRGASMSDERPITISRISSSSLNSPGT